jgi:pimeloyl-ACP methyl ester carboxylesterase
MDVRDTGGEGPPIVFLHGAFVDGTLWDAVVERLPGRRCIVPTLPLGSHQAPVADRSALTPAGVADAVAALLEQLDLRDVTLVANDTGGVLAQLLVTRHPQRIAKLVLTPCDALEVFPPALFKPLFWASRSALTLEAFVAPLRIAPLRRLPLAYGRLTRRATRDQLARWTRPALTNRAVLRDAAHFISACDPAVTLDVAPQLRTFAGDVVLAWARDDRCFGPELGRRLAAQFRAARFIEVPDSFTFVPVDRPDALAELL